MTKRLPAALAAALLLALPLGPGFAQPGPFGRGIVEIARVYELEPALVAAIISVESDFNPRAVSRKGARGMMQLMPATARDLGVGNIDDPWDNIEGGARYFREKLDRFGGDLRLALAAYNAGEASVRQHGGVPPYPETVGFVSEVLARYQALKARGLPGGGSPELPASVPTVPPPPEPPAPPDRSAQTAPAIVLEVEDVGPSAKAVAQLRAGARLAREGQLAKAAEHYRSAQALAPASPEPHNLLGLVYLKLGRLAEAQEAFEAALRMAPSTPSFLNNLGLVLHMRGDFRRAVGVLRRAWEGEPPRVESGVNLALVLRHLGRREEARSVLTRVLAIRERLPEGHLNLASLLDEDGDRASAVLHYRRFLDLTDGEASSVRDDVRSRVAALEGR